MSAHHNLSGGQFQQLPMFMPAGELRDQVTPGDIKNTDPDHLTKLGIHTSADFWDRKVSESRAPGTELGAHRDGTPRDPTRPSLANSVAASGVREPVSVWHEEDGSRTLWDGHHRVASAHHADPSQLVPVQHLAPETNWAYT